MNPLLTWLSGGDARSDGAATEVSALVLCNPQLFPDLFAGLSERDDVVRHRAADALEKLARSRPDLLAPHLSTLLRLVRQDPVPMVRCHLAIILGHLAPYAEHAAALTAALLDLLRDPSPFVRSWAITSLCILARLYPDRGESILRRIAPLQRDPSVAVRTRATRATGLLLDERLPFPPGWVKGSHAALLALAPPPRRRR